MIKTRAGYTWLLWLALPWALFHLFWRSIRQRAYLQRIPERFGFIRVPAAKPLIWVHAVSVGETRAAAPLIRELRRRYPRHHVLLTHMTPTGLEAGAALFGGEVTQCYLPYDFPFAVDRFLKRFEPDCGILLETEVWPNLIYACRQRGIPLYLVNARLSERSARRYRRFAQLSAECLNALTAIAAQSQADASRFRELGATNVTVAGNVKFDVAPESGLIELGREWRKNLGNGRVALLAASTREGEEVLLLQALATAATPALLFVIVPRHPQRFDDVAKLLEREAIPYQRRSGNRPIADRTRVLLGDSMGEMPAYYAMCDVAIIGGSLLDYGAQNLIEACAVGRPVVVGPSTYNFTEATSLAVKAGAAIQVADAAEAIKAAGEILADSVRAKRMGEAGLEFARAHRGATMRILDLLRV